jgi:hypothetical protein
LIDEPRSSIPPGPYNGTKKTVHQNAMAKLRCKNAKVAKIEMKLL